jgi:hypothetical protein
MQDITDTVPGSVAIEMRVFPVREIGRTLVLATDSKPTTEAKSRLIFILNREVRFVIRSREWIEGQLDAHYRTSNESLEDPSESQGISWFWPSWHYIDGDKLVVKASGWEGMTHWTGAHEFPMDHPDREFWEWLITIDYYSKGLLDDREVPKIKRVWNRYRQRTKAATNNPMNPSGGSGVS